MTKLSVNLNKVALLRNQRDGQVPDVLEHAKIILDAGAHGLTVHPRPDERHIRKSDIPAIADFLNKRNDKNIEFNIEGYPSEEFIKLCLDNKCDQVTLVPDSPSQKTSDHGWDIGANKILLKDAIDRLHSKGRRVSIFVDANPDVIADAFDVEVNAGHDLNLDNLARFIAAIPDCDEVSIGHAITADALKLGWNGAVHAYLTAIEFGKKQAKEKEIS